MSGAVPINSARKTVSYASGELAVTNGVITSFATSASPVTKLPADMTGAAMVSGTGRFAKQPRSLTITLASSAGSYTTNPIVITGQRDGTNVTESLTPSGTDGNETLRGTQIFSKITSIAFPAQGDANGHFTVGVQDIGRNNPHDTFTGIELAAAGTLNVQYGESSGDPTDAIPIAAGAAGVVKPVAPTRVLTNPGLSSPTTVGLTVYIP